MAAHQNAFNDGNIDPELLDPAPHATPVDEELRQIELQNTLDLYNAKALHFMRSQRPKNTKKAYENKQHEWKRFCSKHQFQDGETVHEKKLVFFLQTEVMHRLIRPSRYQKERMNSDGSKISQTLGIEAIQQYINAIVDLWSFQRDIGINHHSNPRGNVVTALISGRLRQESQRKRAEYVDRAVGTLQDGYSKDQIKNFIRFCWQGWKNQPVKGRKPQAQESYLRTAVDFLFSHNMLLRGESLRQLELPDLFTLSLPNEGPTPCWPMIMIMNNGETNQFGRL